MVGKACVWLLFDSWPGGICTSTLSAWVVVKAAYYKHDEEGDFGEFPLYQRIEIDVHMRQVSPVKWWVKRTASSFMRKLVLYSPSVYELSELAKLGKGRNLHEDFSQNHKSVKEKQISCPSFNSSLSQSPKDANSLDRHSRCNFIALFDG